MGLAEVKVYFVHFFSDVTFNVFWSSLGHKFLILSLVIYSSFMIMAFEGNLRASIIKRDHEKPIDSLEELYDSGKILYIPKNSAQLQKYLTSSLDYLRELANIANENNYFYNCFDNCPGAWQTYNIVTEGVIT